MDPTSSKSSQTQKLPSNTDSSMHTTTPSWVMHQSRRHSMTSSTRDSLLTPTTRTTNSEPENQDNKTSRYRLKTINSETFRPSPDQEPQWDTYSNVATLGDTEEQELTDSESEIYSEDYAEEETELDGECKINELWTWTTILGILIIIVLFIEAPRLTQIHPWDMDYQLFETKLELKRSRNMNTWMKIGRTSSRILRKTVEFMIKLKR